MRVIHGHGTGALRRGLAEFLTAHPLVERIHAEADERGGTAVTVVELKDYRVARKLQPAIRDRDPGCAEARPRDLYYTRSLRRQIQSWLKQDHSPIASSSRRTSSA